MHCGIGLTSFILSKFAPSIRDTEDTIHPHILKLLTLMANYKLTITDWQQFIGMLTQENQSLSMLKSLLSMAQNGNTPTFIGFDRTRKRYTFRIPYLLGLYIDKNCRGYECVRVPSVMDGRNWPLACTMMMWVCIKRFRTDKQVPTSTSGSLPLPQAEDFSSSSTSANPFDPPAAESSNPFDSPDTFTATNPFDAVPEQSSERNPFDQSSASVDSDAALRPWNAVYLFSLKSDYSEQDAQPLNISGTVFLHS